MQVTFIYDCVRILRTWYPVVPAKNGTQKWPARERPHRDPRPAQVRASIAQRPLPIGQRQPVQGLGTIVNGRYPDGDDSHKDSGIYLGPGLETERAA
jgi:hypothetical protein